MPENEVPEPREEQSAPGVPDPEASAPAATEAEAQSEEAVPQPEAPPSTPQPPARRAYGPKEKALIAVLMLAIVAGVYITVRNLRRQYLEAKAQTEAANDMTTPLAYDIAPAPEPVGSPDAKVKIVASMGHCIAPAMKEIAKMVSAWPDKVRAEFYTLESPEGQQVVQTHNASRACVIINDKLEFTIRKDGKEQRVRLEGPPGVEYQLADMVEALRATLQQVYGEVPNDFDERAAPLLSLKLKIEPTGKDGCGKQAGCEAPQKGGSGAK
ncbi:MAG: hypothetical protein GXP31_18640 [Kiritimatiellaeota bacterium]|nr:hypothetical protein [Kiritimatiellota bacterium]